MSPLIVNGMDRRYPSRAPIGTAINTLKLYGAWSKKKSPRLLRCAATVIIPALILADVMSASSILVSKVATSQSGGFLVRARSGTCGLVYYPGGNFTASSEQALLNKISNDTVSARNYAIGFYANETDTIKTTKSTHVQSTLPYYVDHNADCPFNNATFCWSQSTPIKFYSGMTDSHTMLGINATRSDRVTFQFNSTCASIEAALIVVEEKNPAYILAGPNYPNSYTYMYPFARLDANIGYEIT